MSLKRRFTSGLLGLLGEVLKLAREMLVIPAQLWLLAAEIVGAAVLRAWLSAVLPALRLAWGLLVATYGLCARQVTPRRAVAAVGIAAAAALIASQWLDYRSVSVGTPAYQGELDLIAPAPDVARDRAGEAHAWVMIPIAGLGAAGIWLALLGHLRAAWLAVAAGVGAIAIAVGIDAPTGLDVGPAAITSEGAAAQLLEGFWAQIASGAALAGAGLLSFAHGRPERATARRRVRVRAVVEAPS